VTTQGSAAGQVDGADEFNGVDDYVEDMKGANYLNGLAAITVSLWVKSDVISTDNGFLRGMTDDGNDTVLAFRYDVAGANGGGANVIKATIGSTGGDQQIESSSYVQTNVWQNVVLVWSSGNQLSLYINGVLDIPTANDPATAGTITNATELLIGKCAPWDGMIDEVNISTVTRSSNWLWATWMDTASNSVFNSYGSIVTLVVLSRFDAHESGGQAVLDWETASEVDTAGFYVYRRSAGDGDFVQINKGLLPAVVGSPQGGTYRYTDTTYASGKTCTYRLVEIETSGKRNICGDCTLNTASAGSPKNLISSKSSIPAYSSAARTSALKSARTTLRQIELKSLQSLAPKAKEQGGIGGGGGPGPTLGNIKIKLTASGVYYVSASDIATALGTFDSVINIAIAGGEASLSCNGNQVAYLPAESGAGIYFYGQALESLYATQNVYMLTWQTGPQMAVQTLQTQAATDGTFVDTLHIEQDVNSAPGFFTDPTADYWFWDYMVGGTPGKSFTVHLDGVAAVTGNAALKVSLFGATSTGTTNEHHAVISLNGTQVGEVQWTGLTATNVTCTFDQSLLIDGDNTILIADLLDSGAPYSTIYLDSFDATWHRRYEAVNDQLLLRGDGNAVVTVNGFTSTNVQVLDVSNPLTPQLVAGATVEQTGAWYRVSFVPSDSSVPYVAFASADTPLSVTADSQADLRATTNEAQYVVITVPELKTAAQSLADYRATKGLKTMVVLLEDIYDNFNNGLPDPNAIRSFLSYATFKWQTSPRYVVLAGEGSYDYRNIKGYGDSIIPPIMVGTPNGLFASDSRYGDLNNDQAAELAIGPMPLGNS
jgi:hypothetical protein